MRQRAAVLGVRRQARGIRDVRYRADVRGKPDDGGTSVSSGVCNLERAQLSVSCASAYGAARGRTYKRGARERRGVSDTPEPWRRVRMDDAELRDVGGR